jgi:cytoskeletal protein RodZ
MSATKPPSYDDRFVVPLEPSRRGAHRARMSPLIASLPIIAVVAVVVAVIALAWTLFGGTLFGGDPGNTIAASVTPQPSISSASPSTSAAPSTGASTPSTGSTASAEVDKAESVTVLNSTGTAGLARKAAAALQDKGWTKVQASYTSAAARPTTVFYATSGQKATAQALADDLGVGLVKKSAAMAGDGITVVLGTDYVS